MSGGETEAARARECVAVILAAGKSTRMKSALPKAVHPLCGRAMTAHVVQACRDAGIERQVVVVGHQADAVRTALGPDLDYALQAEQRGTGHAVLCAADLLADHEGSVLVLAGDVPLLRAETLAHLLQVHREGGAAATLLTAVLDDATGYGRVVRGPDGEVLRIVEQRDASSEELAIREWNPSIYCFDARKLFAALQSVGTANAQGEMYLTDVIGILVGAGERVAAVQVAEAVEVSGVNTRAELAAVAAVLRQRILHRLMLSGVTVVDPATTYVDAGVTVGPDTVLEPGTLLRGAVVIGPDCVIGPWSTISDSEVGGGTAILASQVAGSRIGAGVRIGPYANLRPGATLADGVRIGDFVEIKNATLGEGVCASHLSYIGDAEVGADTNIGAGVVTCNYDGFDKHRTIIGRNAFVGTHVTLVAPITVGDDALIAAGSPVTQDVPAGALAVARCKTTIKEAWAHRWRSLKEKQNAGQR